MCSLVICSSSLQKCLFKSFAHFWLFKKIVECYDFFMYCGSQPLIRYVICKYFSHPVACLFTFLMVFFEAQKFLILPWPDSSVGYSIILMHQSCRFNPWSGHLEESTNECISKWNNTLIFLTLFLSSPSLPL